MRSTGRSSPLWVSHVFCGDLSMHNGADGIRGCLRPANAVTGYRAAIITARIAPASLHAHTGAPQTADHTVRQDFADSPG